MSMRVHTCVAVSTLAGIVCTLTSAPAAEPDAAADRSELVALRTEVDQLKNMTPSQSHAMADVDYHFANLWFASRYRNWPLAVFYLNETKSHINWTVRLRPVRKLASGQDLDLRPLLQAIELSGLTQIRTALDKHDVKAFESAYRVTMSECYACHVASEKPFLRPRVPESPATHMIGMRPGG